MFWASLGKIAVSIGLRLVVLFILFLIQWSQEELEETVKDPSKKNTLETVLTVLTCVYIGGVTIIFVIYLLVTSGSRLALDPSSTNLHDAENPCSCSCVECYGQCTGICEDNTCPHNTCHCVCCSVCSCCTLCCRVFCALCRWCKQIKCSPFTCCRRPGELACGLFCRIFLREIPGLAGTILILIFEYDITKNGSAIVRAGIIMACIIAAQVVGYVLGILVGRWVERCCHSTCDCSPCCRPPHTNDMLLTDN